MSGPAPTDIVTYSAPANWFTCGSTGTAGAATDQPVFNYAGQLEGTAFSLPGFNIPITLQAGLNHPPQSTFNQHSHLFTSKDKMFTSTQWSAPGGVTFDNNFNPISWTSTDTITCNTYQDVLGYYDMVHSGSWVIKYKDAFYSGGTTATTSINLVPGPRYTFGTPNKTVVGDIVTITIPSTFNWTPGAFTDANMMVTWSSSDGVNHVTHPNNPLVFRPMVMGPGETDNGLYYDASDYIIANLISATGTAPAFIRFMDTWFSDAGINNFCTNSSRMPANLTSWNLSNGSSGLNGSNYQQNVYQQQPATVVQFEFARFYNSDPSSSTYAWSSPKLYNSGWIPTGSDATGFYLNIADGPNGASDNGRIILGSNPQDNGIVEFRTTNAGGHGFQTGQWALFDFNGGAGVNLPFTIRGTANVFSGQNILPLFVTGPNTVATSWGFGSGSGSTADTINSTTEISLTTGTGCYIIMQCPVGLGAPVEYHCAFVNRLPNANYWHNAPPLGTTQHDPTGFHYASGFTAGTTLGPTHGVRFEFNNEFWNGGNTFTSNFLSVQANFSAYAPSGAPIYGGYTTAGASLGSAEAAELFSCAQAFDAFKAGWVAAGRSTTQLKNYIGAQFTGPQPAFFVPEIVATGMQCGAITVAPYAGVQTTLNGTAADQSIQNIWYPPGLNGDPTQGEGWPVWQLNDFLSFYVAFDVQAQGYWQLVSAYTVPASIPIACYEGGYQGLAIDGFQPIDSFTAEDQMSHPSFHDAITRYLIWEQLGDWTTTTTGGGAIAANYYTWAGSGGAPGIQGWKIAAGSAQRPGLGLSNTYFLPQGGVGGLSGQGNTQYVFNNGVATGYAPINQSPGLQAILDWSAGGVIPPPPPPPPPTENTNPIAFRSAVLIACL